MSSLITDIADGMVTELNANQNAFSITFTAVRTYVPEQDFNNLKTLKVEVVPNGSTETTADRGSTEKMPVVSIGIRKEIANDDEIPSLMQLTDDIGTFFRLRRLAKPNDYAMWVKTENNPIYDMALLHDKGVFATVVNITYKVIS